MWEFVSRDTEKCLVSVLSSLMLEKMYELFCQDKQNYLFYVGVCIKWVSTKRGSPVYGKCKSWPVDP